MKRLAKRKALVVFLVVMAVGISAAEYFLDNDQDKLKPKETHSLVKQSSETVKAGN